MNKDIYEALLKIKQQVANGTLTHRLPETLTHRVPGICYHLSDLLDCFDTDEEAEDAVLAFMQEACPSWKHFSGDGRYPVPSPEEGISPYSAYTHPNSSRWTGAYGELRKSLLNHLIEFAREASNERNPQNEQEYLRSLALTQRKSGCRKAGKRQSRHLLKPVESTET